MSSQSGAHRGMDLPGATLLILFNILLGLNQALIKIVNEGLAPIFQSGLRSACAFVLVFAFTYLFGRRFSIRSHHVIPGLIVGLIFAFEFAILFIALEFTTVSRVSVLFYTQPFWVALGAHFLLDEKLSRLKAIGLMFALAGVILLVSSKGQVVGGATLLGDVLCIAASMMWAAIALILRTSRLSEATPETQLMYQLSVSAIVLLAIAPFFGGTIRELTPTIVAIFAFQIIGIASAGYLAWMWALSVYRASEMSSFGLLAPLSGVLFGWQIFNDQLDLFFGGALLMVCIGIVLVNLPQKQALTEL